MRRIIPFLIIVYLLGCDNNRKNNGYSFDLTTAKDAFEYPNLSAKSDTDIYVYQLKDTLNRRDSFLYVNYGSFYLKHFDEKNLSLRPLELETFRFSYCPFGGKPLNITFDRNEIVVKLGVSGSLDRVYSETKLDSLEKMKFKFLEYYFFRSRHSISQNRIKYYDSMVTKYPELNSIKYYKQLIDKYTNTDSNNFKYATQKIHLSSKQYQLLLDSLKKSNFENLPWRIVSSEILADGGGYTFEANTKTKYKFFVCESNPIDSLPMTRFCKYLLHLANVDKDIKL